MTLFVSQKHTNWTLEPLWPCKTNLMDKIRLISVDHLLSWKKQRIVISLLVGIVAIGTLYDLYRRCVRRFHRSILHETNIVDTQSQTTINSEEKEKLIERYEADSKLPDDELQ